MTDIVKISFHLEPTDPDVPLGFEAWVDDNKFFDTDHVQTAQDISVDIDDTEAEHVLRLIMKHKTFTHTKINDASEIVQDARLVVNDIAFDGIKLGQVFTELATYTHDFNGTGSETKEKFYSEIGCNGTVRLEFSTPVYLWLLEHM
jgi:hypothetical protein